MKIFRLTTYLFMQLLGSVLLAACGTTQLSASSEQTIIDAPVERVWAVLAEDFAGIGKWASSVNHSVGAGGPAIAGEAEGDPVQLAYSERYCDISSPGFDDAKERIVAFEAPHLLQYEIYEGLPSMVSNAVNTWTLREEDGKTVLQGTTTLDISAFMGFVGGWMIRRDLRRVLDEMAEESKYFIETGEVHPRKAEAMRAYAEEKADAESGGGEE